MKRLTPYLLLLTVLALAVAAFAPATVAAAPVQYPEELEYVNAQLEVFEPRLAEFQANYLSANGVYFQALQSHTTPPEGVDPADNLYSSPTDQAVALATLWEFSDLPDEIGWSYRVDTYAGPDGPGYVLTVTVLVKGDTWIKAVNVGPDAWRAADWYQYVEDVF